MNYVLKQQKRQMLPSAGQYVARAVHQGVVDTEQIATMIQENCTLKRADVLAVLSELEEVLCRELKLGNIVTLSHLGRFKLEIVARPVPTTEHFDPHEHITGLRLHFIPESRNGRQPFYEGVTLHRLEGDRRD